jgi:hypothetical protein
MWNTNLNVNGKRLHESEYHAEYKSHLYHIVDKVLEFVHVAREPFERLASAVPLQVEEEEEEEDRPPYMSTHGVFMRYNIR